MSRSQVRHARACARSDVQAVQVSNFGLKPIETREWVGLYYYHLNADLVFSQDNIIGSSSNRIVSCLPTSKLVRSNIALLLFDSFIIVPVIETRVQYATKFQAGPRRYHPKVELAWNRAKSSFCASFP